MNTGSSRIDEILFEAVKIPSESDRQEYLDRVCGSDAEIRSEVEELVAHYFADPTFLEPAEESASGADQVFTGLTRLAEISDLLPRDGVADLQVLSDFRIIREIGRGGMGVVYEAIQVSLERRVALKVLPFTWVLDSRHVQRFQAEAKAAASLHHPHIVPVFQIGCEGAVNYYAMQFIQGQNFAQLIQLARQSDARSAADELTQSLTGGSHAHKGQDDGDHTDCDVSTTPKGTGIPATPGTNGDSFNGIPEVFASFSMKSSTSVFQRTLAIASIGVQIAEALEYAHGQGVLHRDIKPSNLILDNNGKLWLTDFGVARIEGAPELTVTGDVVGTLQYMSPEQALGCRGIVDQRSDVYSLGATLYELTTFTPMFSGQSRGELMDRIAHQQPTHLRAIDRDIPRDFETIVLKCVAKEPLERYRTAGQLADDLRRFIHQKPILARRMNTWERGLKWCRRHLALVLLTLTIVGLLSVAVVVTTVAAVEARNNADELQTALKELSEESQRTKDALAQADKARADAETARQRAFADRQTAQLTSYRSDVKIAFDRYNDGRLMEAYDSLAHHRPHEGEQDFRGIEWWYLNTKINDQMRLVGLHQGGANCLAVFPDRKRVATTGDRGVIRIWDVQTRSLLREFSVHDRRIFSIAIAPHGRWLAYGEEDYPYDSHVVIIDAATGEELARLNEHSTTIRSISFSPDGRYLLSGSANSEVKLWQFSEGLSGSSRQLIPDVEEATNEDICVLDDGRLLLSKSGDSGYSIWNLDSHRHLSESDPLRKQKIHTFTANASSGLAAMIFTAKTDDPNASHRMVIANLDTGRLVSEIDAYGDNLVRFSPGGQSLFVGGLNGWLTVYKIKQNSLPDSAEVTVELAERVRLANGSIESIAALDEHRILCASSDGRIVLFNHPSQDQPPTEQLKLPSRSVAAAVSPDGNWLISSGANGRISVVDYKTGKTRFRTQSKFDSPIPTCIVWSNDGKRVAAINERGRFHIYGFENGKLSQISAGEFEKRSATHSAHQIALSRNPAEFFTIGNEIDQFYMWETQNPSHPHQIITDAQCTQILVTPDDKLVVTANDDIRIYDHTTLSERHRLTTGPRVSDLLVAQDSRTLATAHVDGSIHIWNLNQGKLVYSLYAHQHTTRAMAFAQDHTRLISGDDAGQLHFWDLRSGDHFGYVNEFPTRNKMIQELWIGPENKWLDVTKGFTIKSRRLLRIPIHYSE